MMTSVARKEVYGANAFRLLFFVLRLLNRLQLLVYTERQMCYDHTINDLKEEGPTIEPATLARRAVALADEKQASDITLLDIRQVSTIADYFVICSAETDRQIRAIVESIDDGIKKETGLDARQEGTPDTGWVVLDYADVVVHVLSEEQREYYSLEQLWSKAPPVVVLQ